MILKSTREFSKCRVNGTAAIYGSLGPECRLVVLHAALIWIKISNEAVQGRTVVNRGVNYLKLGHIEQFIQSDTGF